MAARAAITTRMFVRELLCLLARQSREATSASAPYGWEQASAWIAVGSESLLTTIDEVSKRIACPIIATMLAQGGEVWGSGLAGDLPTPVIGHLMMQEFRAERYDNIMLRAAMYWHGPTEQFYYSIDGSVPAGPRQLVLGI